MSASRTAHLETAGHHRRARRFTTLAIGAIVIAGAALCIERAYAEVLVQRPVPWDATIPDATRAPSVDRITPTGATDSPSYGGTHLVHGFRSGRFS